MSAIAGVYRLNGRPVETPIMGEMVDRMHHRGPDAQNYWSRGSVGLGHGMLHTTPESFHATLPHESAQSGCVITADARIDNRDELLSDLRLHSGPDQVIPDSTLILRAYEKWGRDCVNHLLGAFVFAIWDPREHQLFCAQDHFGIRPFYYYHEQGELFAFASEIKALFALESAPKELNEVRIAEHLLAPIEEDVTRTYFKHIRRTAPAHTLVVKPDSITTQQYWALDPDRELQLSSDEEYTQRFRELFEEAVRVRLRSTRPIGSELSGGLDSSSVTCQAAQILRDSGKDATLHTFSGVFKNPLSEDEHPYINAVLEKYNELESHLIWGDEKSPLAEWDVLYEYLDGACEAPNVYFPMRVNKLAQDKGIRVVLSGYDGDTTISHGRGYFYQLRNEGRWLKLVKEVGAYSKGIGESPRGAIWSWIKGPLCSLPGMPTLVKARQYATSFFSHQKDDRQETEAVPAWKRALSSDLSEIVDVYLDEEDAPKPSTEREQHYQRLTRPVMTRIPYLGSHIGSISSVVHRYPFFDKNLVEFCLALPPQQKIRNGWSRLILRQGMEDVLPSPVQWRAGKTDYSMQLEDLLNKYERDLFEELGSGNLGAIDPFVDPEFLGESVPKFLDGRSNTREMGEGLVVWRALALALWLEQREPSPRTPSVEPMDEKSLI